LGRSTKLRKLSDYPFCAETAKDFMYDHFYTPNKMFFERNHNLIPEIDPEEYELQLLRHGKKDEEPIVLSLEEIKAMPSHTLNSYLSCAGNKRSYLQNVHPKIKGLKWTNGAIGNA